MHFMQSPSAPEVLCNRCGGKKVIEYKDPVPLSKRPYRMQPCDCFRGATALGLECPKCKGEGAFRVYLDNGA